MTLRSTTCSCILSSANLRSSETDSDGDDNDKSYKYQDPPTSGNKSSASNSEGSDGMIAPIVPSGKGKKLKKKKAKVSKLIDDDTDITIEDVQDSRAGRNPVRAQWAFSLWNPKPAFNKEKLVWRWSCNFCL